MPVQFPCRNGYITKCLYTGRQRWNRRKGRAMEYTTICKSPLGDILLVGDERGLTGLYFPGQKYCGDCRNSLPEEKEIPLFKTVREWLDIYFSGREPDFRPSLHVQGTPFQRAVWEILLTIPYGQTTTYGAIAERLSAAAGGKKMSAQAVGGAVGHNPVSIIIPCHRVVGKNGSLTGYAGGLDKKIWLLRCEGAAIDRFFVPARGTAL